MVLTSYLHFHSLGTCFYHIVYYYVYVKELGPIRIVVVVMVMAVIMIKRYSCCRCDES